jgi:hypothetical protein
MKFFMPVVAIAILFTTASIANDLKEQHEKAERDGYDLDKAIKESGGTRLQEEDRNYHRQEEREKAEKEKAEKDSPDKFGQQWLNQQLGR